MDKLEKNLRKRIRRAYKRAHRLTREDSFAVSMLYRERTRTNGEYWKEYGFILPEDIVCDYDPEEATEWDTYTDLTDAEVNEWFRENMFVRIVSDYDCTGRPFTVSINWHRNPCGLISYVHNMAIDV